MSILLRLAAFLSIFLVGSISWAGSKVYYPDGQDVQELLIKEKLKHPPTEWKSPIHIDTIGQTSLVSAHIVWIKTHENLHYHAKHEGTLMLLRGRGHLRLGTKNIALKPGDVITIPHGVVHAFTNDSKEPAVAYVVFAPPFDGKDAIEIGSQVQ